MAEHLSFLAIVVQRNINVLKDRMSEKGHPEHSSFLAILSILAITTYLSPWTFVAPCHPFYTCHHDIPFILNIRRSLPSFLYLPSRHTLHLEHSSLLVIVSILAITTYPSSWTFVAPCHCFYTCHHDIPFILNIRRSLPSFLYLPSRHTLHLEHSSLLAIVSILAITTYPSFWT
jgi:hypothetical protein